MQAGTPIATVLALDPIIVRAEVGELDIARIAVGGKATVRLISGAELEGTVRTISNESSAQTRTFAVDVSLPNSDRTIPSGMTAEVSLFTDPVSAVMVPRSVITLSAEGKIGLRVVGADNVARFVRGRADRRHSRRPDRGRTAGRACGSSRPGRIWCATAKR